MWRRTERFDDELDDVVHRRFVRVIGLPGSAELAWDNTDERPPAGHEPASGEPPGDEPAGREAPGNDPAGREPAGREPTGELAVVTGGDSPAASRTRVLAAFDPGRRGVRAMVAVAVAVVAIAAFVAWHSRPRAEAIPPRMVAAGPASESPGAALVIAVAGRVRQPGLVRLPVGARVADAIEAAGGPAPGTDLSYVNLARKLADGELLLIGVTPPPGVGSGPYGGQAPGDQPNAGAAPGGQLNLNTATATQLQTLPGVGPVLAQRIVDHRTKQGPFRSVNDLRQVDGIGDARFKQLKDLVVV
ncbi:MAG TPA: ComEA family DNA-binding protein [Micromonosporaceae bacterium]|nr:ComEA family DNA-binding protein [Micromonosporaceae bacterium]